MGSKGSQTVHGTPQGGGQGAQNPYAGVASMLGQGGGLLGMLQQRFPQLMAMQQRGPGGMPGMFGQQNPPQGGTHQMPFQLPPQLAGMTPQGGAPTTMARGGKVKKKNSKVTLTKQERAFCKQMGWDEMEFARNKLRMLAERGE